MSTDKREPDGYIELKFGPRWKYIASARAFIQNFLALSITQKEMADKLAMAASELLENAVKYANGEDTHIYVHVFPNDDQVSVIVENKASPEACETLRTIFEKISQGDPLEAYISQMKEAALRKDGKSQLGLARIRYETGGKLQLEIQDNAAVRITLSVE